MKAISLVALLAAPVGALQVRVSTRRSLLAGAIAAVPTFHPFEQARRTCCLLPTKRGLPVRSIPACTAQAAAYDYFSDEKQYELKESVKLSRDRATAFHNTTLLRARAATQGDEADAPGRVRRLRRAR